MYQITIEQYDSALMHILPALKEALFSASTSRTLSAIYQRNNLDIKQSFDVSALIGFILVGLMPVKNLITEIQQQANVNTETARRIAYDIRQEIFAPVAQELAAIQPGALAVKKQAPVPLKEGLYAAQEFKGYIPKLSPNAQLHEAPPEYKPKTRGTKLETKNMGLKTQNAKFTTWVRNVNLEEKIVGGKQMFPQSPRIKPNIPQDNVVNLRRQ